LAPRGAPGAGEAGGGRPGTGNRCQRAASAAGPGEDGTMGTDAHVPPPDRLLPADPAVREIARGLYELEKDQPIVSPHGHVDPRLLLDDEPFRDPTSLFITPDHYVNRLMHAR